MNNEPIFFWRAEDEFGAFSNFYPSPLMIDGYLWPTAEHYYQASKTLDLKEMEQIRKAPTPKEAKRLGQICTINSDWEEVKYAYMVHVLEIKFSQPKFREMLLNTGNRPLYEASPYDQEWGTGEYNGVGTGKNLLGKALMQTRSKLRGELL
jgi:N-glycosidase YbiA